MYTYKWHTFLNRLPYIIIYSIIKYEHRSASSVTRGT